MSKHLNMKLMSPKSQKLKMSTKKTKKCQPAASDTHIPDLIKLSVSLTAGWHATKKCQNNQNMKPMDSKCQKFKKSTKKTKKCQPAASDTHIPDLIQTECVADSGLARQNKKNKLNEKNKNERLMAGKRNESYQKEGKQNSESKKKKFYISGNSKQKLPHSPDDKWIKGMWLQSDGVQQK